MAEGRTGLSKVDDSHQHSNEKHGEGSPMPGKGKWVPARSGMNSVLDAMGNYPFGMDSCAR